MAGLLRAAFDMGVNFWDTADEYGSHPHFNKALRGLPRDEIVIVTKTTSRKEADAASDVERFLRELGTEYIDILLLHCLSQRNWTSSYSGAMEAVNKAKETGKVRAVGLSIHGLGALETAAETDWADVVMVRINPRGRNMDASPQKVLPLIEKIYQRGKAVYGMKIFGAGPLAGEGEKMLEYVLRLGTVHAFTIGMKDEAQLTRNVSRVNALAGQYGLKQLA